MVFCSLNTFTFFLFLLFSDEENVKLLSSYYLPISLTKYSYFPENGKLANSSCSLCLNLVIPVQILTFCHRLFSSFFYQLSFAFSYPDYIELSLSVTVTQSQQAKKVTIDKNIKEPPASLF